MKKTILLPITVVLLIVLFFTTDPQKLPPVALILPFALIFALLFYTSRLFILKRTVSPKRAARTALLCAVLPTLLLVLQSIGQLTVRDVATSAVLFALSYFYISRNVPARD